MENQGQDTEIRISSILYKMFKNMDLEDNRRPLEAPKYQYIFQVAKEKQEDEQEEIENENDREEEKKHCIEDDNYLTQQRNNLYAGKITN